MIWFKTVYVYMHNVDCRHSRDPGNGCLPCFWSWLCTRPWRRFWTPCLQWCAPLHGWPCTSLHVRLVSGSFFLILLNETMNCTWHTDIGLFTIYCEQGNILPVLFSSLLPLLWMGKFHNSDCANLRQDKPWRLDKPWRRTKITGLKQPCIQ